MSEKAGSGFKKLVQIFFLAAAFIAVAGTVSKTEASINITSCFNSLVSTNECIELLSQSCVENQNPPVLPKQIQSIVIAQDAPRGDAGQNQPSQTAGNTLSVPLPTMAPLNSEMATGGAILNSDVIFDLVNKFRQSQGLNPFEKDDKVCELAFTRSTELPSEITNGTLHSGLYNRDLPYWIFENAKYGSNEEGTVSWWLNSPLHRSSILGDYKFSCVKCNGSYCSELFTSFSPK